MIFQRVDRLGRSFSCGTKRRIARQFSIERGFGLHDTARGGLRTADTNARVSDCAAAKRWESNDSA